MAAGRTGTESGSAPSRAEGVPGAAAMMLQTCSTRTWPTQTWPILRRLAFALTASAAAAWPIAAGAQVTVTVDAAANRRPINPNVYGVAYATTAQLLDLNVPLNRYGGNNTTRYNWQLNADNRGNDWYFESIAESQRHAPASAATLSSPTRARPAREPMITIPMHRLGRQARRRTAASSPASRSPSTAPQTGSDWQWFPDAGNGIRSQRPARHRQRPERRQRAVDARLPAGLGAAPGQPLGHQRAGGAALLHPRQRAQHLALDASRRPADRRDDGRGPRQDRRLTPARSRPSTRARWSSGPRSGAGAATSSAATTSSTAASTAGASCPIAPPTAARTTCRWLLDQLAPAIDSDRPAAARRLHRALLPAGRRVRRRRLARRCSCGATARRARCGIRTTSTRPGSTTRAARSRGCGSWVDTTTTRARRSASPSTTGAPKSHINGATAQADILGIFGREGLDMARALDDAGRRRRRPTRR